MHRLLTIALLSMLLCLPAFGADSAAGLVARYEALKLGPSSAMHDQTFESGHLKITLRDGTAAPVLDGDTMLR